MNCRSAESLFSALIEDELSQNERRSLETHLLSCRKCSVSLKETRAAMELFQSLPMVDTSPHFEEDVMTRIRSGEGLRPSLIEWARGLLAPPTWLRPVAVAGAGACFVWVAAIFVYPHVNGDHNATPIASVEKKTQAPSPAESPSTVTPDAPAVSVAQGPGHADIASQAAPVTRDRATRTTTAPRVEGPSGVVTASETPVQGFTGGAEIPNPAAGYIDEYITDQFYLDRGNGGSGTPGITPVSGRPSDDVYIVF